MKLKNIIKNWRKNILPKWKYSGISGNIDKLTQTVNLKVSIDGDSFVLPVDIGVSKAKIYGKTYEDVFVIPNKSINEKNEIYVVDENTLLKKKLI